MTKAQELEALDGFIKTLPADSYLGVWLRSVREQVESDLRGDLFPSCTPAEARAVAHGIETSANARASDVVARAQFQAGKILTDAEEKAASIAAGVERQREALYRAASMCQHYLDK